MNIVEVLKTDPTGSQNKLDVTYTIILEIRFIKYMNIVEVLKTGPTGSQNKLDVTYTIIHGL